MPSDPLMTQIPIIGMWVHGICSRFENIEKSEQEKAYLLAFCMEYVNNTIIKNRYSFDQHKKTFLLALFSPEEGSRFYEVDLIENTGGNQ